MWFDWMLGNWGTGGGTTAGNAGIGGIGQGIGMAGQAMATTAQGAGLGQQQQRLTQFHMMQTIPQQGAQQAGQIWFQQGREFRQAELGGVQVVEYTGPVPEITYQLDPRLFADHILFGKSLQKKFPKLKLEDAGSLP